MFEFWGTNWMYIFNSARIDLCKWAGLASQATISYLHKYHGHENVGVVVETRKDTNAYI